MLRAQIPLTHTSTISFGLCSCQLLHTASRVRTTLVTISLYWSANTTAHWRTSLVSSFLLLQQYPTCLARLIW